MFTELIIVDLVYCVTCYPIDLQIAGDLAQQIPAISVPMPGIINITHDMHCDNICFFMDKSQFNANMQNLSDCFSH